MNSKTCENCLFFDNEKHKNDSRTETAGICKNWCEITFKNETCKSFFDVAEKTWEELTNEKIIIVKTQLNLFQ
jgi:hypothetical protein